MSYDPRGCWPDESDPAVTKCRRTVTVRVPEDLIAVAFDRTKQCARPGCAEKWAAWNAGTEDAGL